MTWPVQFNGKLYSPAMTRQYFCPKCGSERIRKQQPGGKTVMWCADCDHEGEWKNVISRQVKRNEEKT